MFPMMHTDNPLLPDLYQTVDAWLTAVSAFVTRTHGHFVESPANLHRNSEKPLRIDDLNGMSIWVVMEKGSNEGHYVSITAVAPQVSGKPIERPRTLLSIKTFAGRRCAVIVQHDLSLMIGD